MPQVGMVPDFSGREQMPRLAHQRENYLLKAMREYQSGARVGYAGPWRRSWWA